MDTIDKIFALMGETGTTSYRIEKEVGIPSGLISQWRHRKQNPSLKNVKRLAKYFQVPVEYFLDDEGDSENQSFHQVSIEEAFDEYRKDALSRILSADGVNCAIMAEKLSSTGKKKVMEYIDDLLATGKYSKK